MNVGMKHAGMGRHQCYRLYKTHKTSIVFFDFQDRQDCVSISSNFIAFAVYHSYTLIIVNRLPTAEKEPTENLCLLYPARVHKEIKQFCAL